MNFLKRLWYFVFGSALGCVLVYVMLIRDREFPAWLPEDRIIEEICRDSIQIKNGITLPFPDSLLKARIQASEVLLKQSEPRKEPCREYQLTSASEHMRFRICKDTVSLIEFEQR